MGMDYEEGLSYNERVLDTIDIKPYLTKGVDIREVQDQLENDYSYIVKDDYCMDGELFNFMDHYDFKRYLEHRYGIKINYWEEEHYVIV